MTQQKTIDEKLRRSLESQLIDKLPDLAKKHLLVVGDVGLDEYVMGGVSRISPEAPVPVLDVDRQERRVGLAANVAQNVRSLGGKVTLIGVVGNDPDSEILSKLLQESQVDQDHLVVDKNRPTTKKVRIMAGPHHIVRVDHEKRQFLAKDLEDQVFAKLESLLPDCDGVVLEDYGKGLFSESLTQRLIQASHQAQKKVVVDPHRTTPIKYYKGADLFKPNRDEAFVLSRLNIDDLRADKNSIIEVGKVLLDELGAEHLVMTRGPEGMSLFSEGVVTHLPTYAQQVFDVTGAGDTVLATLSLAWFSNWSLLEACVLANSAAGVVVSQVGSVPCHIDELRSYLQGSHESQA